MSLSGFDLGPGPSAFVFPIAARENTPLSAFLCHLHLCRPPAPLLFIIFIIECYMLNIDITRLHLDLHCSPLYRRPDLENPVPHQRSRRNSSCSHLIDIKGKQSQPQSPLYDSDSPSSSSCSETSSSCSSDPGLFTNDEGRQGKELECTAADSEGMLGPERERGRFGYNVLVAGRPGDSNKTLSCRVNER